VQTTSAPPTVTPAPPTSTAAATPTLEKTANIHATAAQQTATAEAVQTATQEAMVVTRVAEQKLLIQFSRDGSLNMRPGAVIPLADFSESLAVSSASYRYWEIDEVEPLANFIIISHIVWEYPDELPSMDAGSCGFGMRMGDDNQNITALLNTTNTLSLNQKTANGYVKLGILAPWGPYNAQIRTYEKAGAADIAIIAERGLVSLYINGYKDSEWATAHYAAGKIGYMILSGSNVGYGIKCSFSNTHVYELTR
jgi:hypothetical protein